MLARILIIEDDASARSTLSDILTINGYRVVAATNGEDGFLSAKHTTPDIIITGLVMARMNGLDLLAACRADLRLQTVPIIVISGRNERDDVRRVMELGAADFISKPFTETEIVRSVAARLEKKELVDELDAFTSTAAHDLKHPLGTLSVRLDLAALATRNNDTAAALLHMEAATRSVFQLSSVIDELLLLSGVRSQVVHPKPIQMPAVVAEACDRLAHQITTSGAVITTPVVWPEAVGHAPWIAHVWVNLLSNASKYAGPNPHITLGGDVCSGGQYARFWVQDAGPGLTEKEQDQMFTPFTRLSTARASGHGLGLSIVRRIIEKLEGRVGVISTPGYGARFWFELPTTSTLARASFAPFIQFGRDNRALNNNGPQSPASRSTAGV